MDEMSAEAPIGVTQASAGTDAVRSGLLRCRSAALSMVVP